jgi:group I intron endonuclease
MKSGIYKILNVVNGKCYVGSAVNLSIREYEHKRQLNNKNHPNKYLQAAWNKYSGWKFEVSVLENCEVNKLIEREQFYIDLYDCVAPKGYNLAPIAGSQLNFKHSEETKKIISKKAKNISDETRAKMKAHIFSNEHKKNMSIARRKRIYKEETKIKHAQAAKNRVWTEESKSKLKASKLGHKVSEETRLLISKTLKLKNRLKFKAEMMVD